MSYPDISANESVNGISVRAIRSEMERMSAAPPFRRSPRLAKFLTFTVQAILEGRAESLKEYSIGIQVFAKPVEFDPRLDSIVRVEARRLRAAVDRYYATDGADSEIRIVYRAGSYAPSFHKVSDLPKSFSALQGSSSMMVLVGSSQVLEQIRHDLEKGHGLVPADGADGSVHALSRGEAASIARTDPGVPVFLVGANLPRVNGAPKLDGPESAR